MANFASTILPTHKTSTLGYLGARQIAFLGMGGTTLA
nr:MAG TPA: hypothetical protein [Caudoviricetes sp.]